MQQEHFKALLQVLGPEDAVAADRYRQLHQRLVRFFSLHPVSDPYILADQAMDRLARRASTAAAEIQSPASFLFGIARLLLFEEQRRQRNEEKAVDHWKLLTEQPSSADADLLAEVELCLNRLKPEQRALILEYYGAAGREKIHHHRAMAERLGLSLNALRNRLLRARKDLDHCVRRRNRDIPASKDTMDVGKE